MIDKPFKNINEQISILKNDRNLLIRDVEAAKSHLIRYGYYEIVNGYKDHFLIDPTDDDKGYKKDADFEHMYSLFLLDNELRTIILSGLEEFEATFKQSLAYAISLKISENPNTYLSKALYNRGKTYHFRRHGQTINTNDRTNLLHKLDKVTHSDIEPFKHYREDHGNIPPWIIVKGLSFGQTIYLYSLSKPEVRNYVIARMLKMITDESLVNTLEPEFKIKQGFGDLLDLYLDYRNLTAHGGRVYNHQSRKHALRPDSKLIYRDSIISKQPSNRHNLKYRSSVGVLIQSLKLFSNTDPYNHMKNNVQHSLAGYCRAYPQDKAF
ncbi:Abi family protein [Limosilactobacillus kribbianus]|uniref:Abi family protein n=1 Tax=Limosilactobacillus kribbianus TaxID=2982695 RepID=UPI002264E188|nr:Abi family protein [Limosilactobacillus kribbianus]